MKVHRRAGHLHRTPCDTRGLDGDVPVLRQSVEENWCLSCIHGDRSCSTCRSTKLHLPSSLQIDAQPLHFFPAPLRPSLLSCVGSSPCREGPESTGNLLLLAARRVPCGRVFWRPQGKKNRLMLLLIAATNSVQNRSHKGKKMLQYNADLQPPWTDFVRKTEPCTKAPAFPEKGDLGSMDGPRKFPAPSALGHLRLSPSELLHRALPTAGSVKLDAALEGWYGTSQGTVAKQPHGISQGITL